MKRAILLSVFAISILMSLTFVPSNANNFGSDEIKATSLEASGAAAASSKCEIFEQNCFDAAVDNYDLCRRSGGNHEECRQSHFVWFFNACMQGTGCPFTPIQN